MSLNRKCSMPFPRSPQTRLLGPAANGPRSLVRDTLSKLLLAATNHCAIDFVEFEPRSVRKIPCWAVGLWKTPLATAVMPRAERTSARLLTRLAEYSPRCKPIHTCLLSNLFRIYSNFCSRFSSAEMRSHPSAPTPKHQMALAQSS